MKHSEIFEALKPLAIDIADCPWRHVAAIVYKNKVVSYGMSQKKSHPFQQKYSKNEEAIYWHAETNAIFNALKTLSKEDLRKAKLYVCRVKQNEDGETIYGMSKPCSGCSECIEDHEIPITVYTLDEMEGYHHYATIEK